MAEALVYPTDKCWSLASMGSVGFAIALLGAGCASGPIVVGLDQTVPAQELPVGARKKVVLLSVADLRPGTALEGAEASGLGAFVVTQDSLTRWVEDAVRRHLGRSGECLDADESKEALSLVVLVKRCYVQSIRGHLSVQIVLEAEWTSSDGAARRHVVRGQRVGSIWWSAQGEIETALRLALEDAVRKL